MLRVGLTGNIGSGKSTVASFFAALGAHVIDADRVAHELLKSGTPTFGKIVAAFGEQILGADGEIDRKKLANAVFSESGRRLELNRIVHPEVDAEITARISALEQADPQGIAIVDAALMVETGGYRACHCLIVVTCDPALQVRRIAERDGLSEGEIRARIASQMPAEEKVKFADYTIDTSGTLQQVREQVEAIYRKLRTSASRVD